MEKPGVPWFSLVWFGLVCDSLVRFDICVRQLNTNITWLPNTVYCALTPKALMIGTSVSEYVFIRVSITALRLVAPLSFIYLATVFWTGTFIPSSWIGWYALGEYAFFTLVYLPRRRALQKVRRVLVYMEDIFYRSTSLSLLITHTWTLPSVERWWRGV
jgi:hypothetical protein